MLPVPEEVDTPSGAWNHRFTFFLLAHIHDQDEVSGKCDFSGKLASSVAGNIEPVLRQEVLRPRVSVETLKGPQACGPDDQTRPQGLLEQGLTHGTSTMVTVANHEDRRDASQWLQAQISA